MLGPLPLNILSYLGSHPELAGPPLHFGAHAAVIGRVVLGAGAWLGDHAVIRADGHDVRAGDDLHLGRGATIHIAHDLHPTILGHRVSIGSSAVVHACEIGDGCVIEEGAVVLDGSVIGSGCVLEAGAVVFPRSKLEAGQLYAGRPAKAQRALQEGELEQRRAAVHARSAVPSVDMARTRSAQQPQLDPTAFVANTAHLRGKVIAQENTSVWYGCELDAAGGEIVIGARTNVQDNSILRTSPHGRIELGQDSTIGHNVTMSDCKIGARCLIGIGSVLAPGTVVEDDVFLAAGATTTAGQVLSSGQLWGGQPAAPIAPLDERKRRLIHLTIGAYCGYAEELGRVQDAAAREAHA